MMRGLARDETPWDHFAKALSAFASCGRLRLRLDLLLLLGNASSEDPCPLEKLSSSPERLGLPCERLKIPVEENGRKVELDAFWVSQKDSDGPVLLYLHGQDANIGKNLHHLERFYDDLNCSILLFDYRGYGATFGDHVPSEAKVYADAHAALTYLVEKLKIDSKRIFIYGHSLGGAVAIELAQHHPETAGLIVECTFTSILDMSALQYNGLLQFLPVDFLLTERFDSLSKVPLLRLPVLFIHGEDDPRVPVEMTHRLHDATPEPRSLCIIPGGGHENCGWVDKVKYCADIQSFFDKHLDANPSSPFAPRK